MKARTFAGTSMLNASAVAMSSADGWILKHATRNFFVPSMLVARSSDVIGGGRMLPLTHPPILTGPGAGPFVRTGGPLPPTWVGKWGIDPRTVHPTTTTGL